MTISNETIDWGRCRAAATPEQIKKARRRAEVNDRLTQYEMIQRHLLSLELTGSNEERQRKADLFGKILETAGFACIYNFAITCDPEMDCRNCDCYPYKKRPELAVQSVS